MSEAPEAAFLSELEHEYGSEKWIRLTIRERIRRCRYYAVEAKERSLAAPPGMKEAYAELAQQWTELAVEMEGSVLRDDATLSSCGSRSRLPAG